MARDVRVNILGDARDFSRAVGQADRDASRLGSSFQRVSGGMARFAGAAALGLGALGVAGGVAAMSFLRAAEESQQVSRQTGAVLESMGASAWASASQIENLATSLSNLTGVDDEVIQSGQNVLLTFGQVQNRVGEGMDIFDRATEAALNMSVALGTDMSTASMQVGRALNDPLRGLTALRRSGIQFTAQQEDQIRAMVEAGDVAGAQTVMLAELERQFGGSAEAQATASQRLSTMWGNLQEQLGEYLLPVAERFTDWMADNLPDAIEKAKDFVSDLVDKGREMVDWMKENETVVASVAAAIGGVLVTAFIAWAVSAGAAAVATIAATWPIIAIGAAVAALAAGFVYLYRENDTFREKVTAVVNFLRDTAWPAVQRGVDVVGTNLVTAFNAAKTVAEALWPAVRDTATNVVAVVGNIVTAVQWVVDKVQMAIDKFRELAGLQGNLNKSAPVLGIGRSSGSASSVLPKFHSGTSRFVAPMGRREGLALLESGEEVRSRSGVASDRGMGGSTIIVQVGNAEVARVVLDALDSAARSGNYAPQPA